jgi:hypothetical protein
MVQQGGAVSFAPPDRNQEHSDLSVFNNQYSVRVCRFLHESDNLSRNAALAALARYARYDDSEFEFDVSGTDRSGLSRSKARSSATCNSFEKYSATGTSPPPTNCGYSRTIPSPGLPTRY